MMIEFRSLPLQLGLGEVAETLSQLGCDRGETIVQGKCEKASDANKVSVRTLFHCCRYFMKLRIRETHKLRTGRHE